MESDLKECEMKKRSLGKMYETLSSQASAVIIFTLQWKEIEERLDSISDGIATRLKELRENEQNLDARELLFESEVNEHQQQLDAKVKELAELDMLAEEKQLEVADARSFLGSLESLLREMDKGLAYKENKVKELSEVERDMKGRLKNLKEELNVMEKKVVDMKQLEDVKSKVRLRIKEESLRYKSMEELRRDLERRERELHEREQKVLTDAKELDGINIKTKEMYVRLVKEGQELQQKERQLEELHQEREKKLEESQKEHEKLLENLYQEREKVKQLEELHQELQKKLETKERHHQEVVDKLEAKERNLIESHQQRKKELEQWFQHCHRLELFPQERIRQLEELHQGRENERKRLRSTADPSFHRPYGLSHPDIPNANAPFYNKQFRLPSNNQPAQFRGPPVPLPNTYQNPNGSFYNGQFSNPYNNHYVLPGVNAPPHGYGNP